MVNANQDSIDLILDQHGRIRTLFEEVLAFWSGGEKVPRYSPPAFQRTFARLRQELEAHLEAEERVFYPFFSRFDEFRTLLTQSFDQNRLIHDLIVETASLREEGRIEKSVHALKHAFDRHAEAEETDFLPLARKVVSRQERTLLARQYESIWRERSKVAA